MTTMNEMPEEEIKDEVEDTDVGRDAEGDADAARETSDSANIGHN